MIIFVHLFFFAFFLIFVWWEKIFSYICTVETLKFKTMKRKIENFIFDTIIYVAAFGLVCTFCQLCAHADKWMGL